MSSNLISVGKVIVEKRTSILFNKVKYFFSFKGDKVIWSEMKSLCVLLEFCAVKPFFTAVK